MGFERHTHEHAVQIEAWMHERGMLCVQGSQRRLDILKAAGLPRIPGPRPVNGGVENGNVYTYSEAVMILRHPELCWHAREVILKHGADRKAPWEMSRRREYWAGVLVALALGQNTPSMWDDCRSGRCSQILAELSP